MFDIQKISFLFVPLQNLSMLSPHPFEGTVLLLVRSISHFLIQIQNVCSLCTPIFHCLTTKSITSSLWTSAWQTPFFTAVITFIFASTEFNSYKSRFRWIFSFYVSCNAEALVFNIVHKGLSIGTTWFLVTSSSLPNIWNIDKYVFVEKLFT